MNFLKIKLMEIQILLEKGEINEAKWMLDNAIKFVDKPQVKSLLNEKELNGISAISISRTRTREVEPVIIREVLAKHNGHRDSTANELGISPRTLYRKMKIHNID